MRSGANTKDKYTQGNNPTEHTRIHNDGSTHSSVGPLYSLACVNSLEELNVNSSSLSMIPAIASSLPDEFLLSPCLCMHANVAVIYDICFLQSVPTLVIEKVETPLSSLLLDVGEMVTLRERVNLAFGIMSAVEYFHDHLNMSHGLICSDTVFVTQQLTAKLLDPLAAYLVTGKPPDSAVGLQSDLEQVTKLLLHLLSDVWSCDLLQSIRLEEVDRKGHCLRPFLEFLDGIRQTAEYCLCPHRHLLCQEKTECS
jgi:hypothetical protein